MSLQSERVLIRPLHIEEADTLLAFRLRNREFFRPYEPKLFDSHFTLETQQVIIKREQLAWQNETAYHFGIFLKETNELIGKLGLFTVVRGAWQNANLGYSMDQNCNGKGYMSEAVTLTLRFAFDKLGLHRIQAPVMPHNTGSIRVLEKNGFRFEGLAKRYIEVNGVWEDHNIYAITQEEWQS